MPHIDWRSESGSAVAEFSMVAGLLTILTLAVVQLGLGLLVRNTVLDAAAEGARHAALADNTLAEGAMRTTELISTAVGSQYASEVTAEYGTWHGQPCTQITVMTTLPVIGLIGIQQGMEVTGHAAREALD